jgi:hypothetical protein
LTLKYETGLQLVRGQVVVDFPQLSDTLESRHADQGIETIGRDRCHRSTLKNVFVVPAQRVGVAPLARIRRRCI